jgi:hypothetical protein
LAGTPLNNASASVYEGERHSREEFSPLNKTSSTLHGGGTALHTSSPGFLRVWGEIRSERERERESAERPKYRTHFLPLLPRLFNSLSPASGTRVTHQLIFNSNLSEIKLPLLF